MQVPLSEIINGIEQLGRAGILPGTWERLRLDADFRQRCAAYILEADQDVSNLRSWDVTINFSKSRLECLRESLQGRRTNLLKEEFLDLFPKSETSDAKVFMVPLFRTSSWDETREELDRRNLVGANADEMIASARNFFNETDQPDSLVSLGAVARFPGFSDGPLDIPEKDGLLAFRRSIEGHCVVGAHFREIRAGMYCLAKKQI